MEDAFWAKVKKMKNVKRMLLIGILATASISEQDVVSLIQVQAVLQPVKLLQKKVRLKKPNKNLLKKMSLNTV